MWWRCLLSFLQYWTESLLPDKPLLNKNIEQCTKSHYDVTDDAIVVKLFVLYIMAVDFKKKILKMLSIHYLLRSCKLELKF